MSSLSGRGLAAEIRAATAARAADLTAAGRPPRLAVVTATADEASAWYVRSLARTAAKAGIALDVTDLVPAAPDRPESQEATVAGIRVALTTLSGDPGVHGILLQTPLPGSARLAELASFIDPAKDVDGANPASLGRLMTGLPAFAPATAAAVLALLDHYQVALSAASCAPMPAAVACGPRSSTSQPIPALAAAEAIDRTYQALASSSVAVTTVSRGGRRAAASSAARAAVPARMSAASSRPDSDITG